MNAGRKSGRRRSALLVLALLALAGAALALRASSDAQAAGRSPARTERTKGAEAPRGGAPATPVVAAERRHAELKPAKLNLYCKYVQPENPNEPGYWEGERLEYEILWNQIPAGRAFLEVRKREPFADKDGPEVWNIRLDTRSNRITRQIFAVKDKAITAIDVAEGFSRSFYMNIREGEYKAEERIAFDYPVGRPAAHYQHVTPADEWVGLIVPLYGKVLDPLAAIYYLRSIDLAGYYEAYTAQTKDEPRLEQFATRDAYLEKHAAWREALEKVQIVLPICTERGVWDTVLVPVERKAVDAPGLGPAQPCVALVPRSARWEACADGAMRRAPCAFNGLFRRRGELIIWLHEIARVPVKFEAETPIGWCSVLLDKHEHAPFARSMP